jgi:hypothetical protein
MPVAARLPRVGCIAGIQLQGWCIFAVVVACILACNFSWDMREVTYYASFCVPFFFGNGYTPAAAIEADTYGGRESRVLAAEGD